jgi:hypothetical protein
MIVLYTGRRGAGKTLTMIKDAYNYYQSGWKIYSNIGLNFPYEYMTSDDMLEIDEDSPINNAVLVIDEIQTMIDSRRSSSTKNVEFSYFVQQIRKRNVLILATTQFSGTVDLRLRQHVDVLAKPRYYKRLSVCEVSYIDLTAVDEMDLWGEYKRGTEIVYNARDVFPLYDTFNIVHKVLTPAEQERKEKRKKKKEKTT